jgi:hypothetical protein
MAPQSTMFGPRDLWGNVKIPSLRALDLSKSDSNGWINIPSNISTPETYSSLVGLPIVGLPLNATSNFTLDSTYISVECGNVKQYPYPGNVGTSMGSTNWTRLEELVPGGQVWTNMTIEHPFAAKETDSRQASFFIDTNRPYSWGEVSESDPVSLALLGCLDGFFGHMNRSRLTDEESKTKRELKYVSTYATALNTGSFGLNVATCLLSQNHLEVMIRCDKDQCATTKVRKSLSDKRLTTLTGFEHT